MYIIWVHEIYLSMQIYGLADLLFESWVFCYVSVLGLKLIFRLFIQHFKTYFYHVYSMVIADTYISGDIRLRVIDLFSLELWVV